MNNNVRMLYRRIYRSDRLLPALIINITSVISVQLSSYFLHKSDIDFDNYFL